MAQPGFEEYGGTPTFSGQKSRTSKNARKGVAICYLHTYLEFFLIILSTPPKESVYLFAQIPQPVPARIVDPHSLPRAPFTTSMTRRINAVCVASSICESSFETTILIFLKINSISSDIGN